jgi:hypothetical protein
MTMVRGLAIALAILTKLVAAGVVYYYVHPIGVRLAESWMGVRSFGDAASIALVCGGGLIAVFSAATALAVAARGRERVLRSAGVTCLLLVTGGALLIGTWITTSYALKTGAMLIATDAYNKYPPILASYDFEALFVHFGRLVLLADIVLTVIAARKPRAGHPSVQQILPA